MRVNGNVRYIYLNIIDNDENSILVWMLELFEYEPFSSRRTILVTFKFLRDLINQVPLDELINSAYPNEAYNTKLLPISDFRSTSKEVL